MDSPCHFLSPKTNNDICPVSNTVWRCAPFFSMPRLESTKHLAVKTSKSLISRSGESVSIFIGFKTDSNAASGVSLCFSVALQHLDGICSYVPSTVPSTKKKWPCQQHPELFVRLFLDVLALASSSAFGVPKLGSKAKVSRARLDMAWSFKGVA